MKKDKVLSNSAFRLIATISLLIGLAILSFSGNPFTLIDPPEADIEAPENLENQELENNTFAERAQNQLQERDVETPEQDLANLENESFIDRMAMGLLERLADTNQTLEEHEEAEGEEQEKDNTDETEEETSDDESDNEDSEQQHEQKEEVDEDSEEQDTDEQAQDQEDESPESEQQQEQEEEQESDEPDQEEAEASGITETIQENSRSILTTLIIIATTIAAAIIYLSDLNIREISKTIFQKLKHTIKTLPDATQRILLNIINFAYSSITRSIIFAKELAAKPVQKTRETLEKILDKFSNIKNKVQRLKQNGVGPQISKLLGKDKERDLTGLMSAWVVLKTKTGLKGEKNLTPGEVKEKALDKNLPRRTVENLVRIFRIEKYSSKSYQVNQKPQELKKDLEQNDE